MINSRAIRRAGNVASMGKKKTQTFAWKTTRKETTYNT